MIAFRQFKFAVNTHGKNKDWNWEILASQYQDCEGTIQDVITHVSSGHALCAGLLGGQRRSKANVIGSEWLLLDIDNSAIQKDANGTPVLGKDGKALKVYDPQLTLNEAIAHPFIQKHCALIYTTASHRDDWHKFRLVFLLPQYVEGSETVEAMVRLLMEHFPHDPACKDASRVFFGSTAATFPHVNPNACLPDDWFDQANALAEEEKARRQAQLVKLATRREQFQQVSTNEGWDTNELIQQALIFIPPRSPGSGNYDECRQVLMALVDYYGSTEGAAIAERWSPSIPGKSWNIAQKVRSFRRSGITIGTLFKIAQGYGFRFPETKKTEWKDPTEPDPVEYKIYVQREEEQERVEQAIEAEDRQKKVSKGFGSSNIRSDRERYIIKRRSGFLSYLQDLQKDFTLTATDKREIFYYKGYAPIFDLSARSILLRGWLGAGKTEAVLRSLLPHRDKQILWLTGRNGLLRQTGKRSEDLGFSDIYHYQDDPALYREMLRTGQPGIYTLCPDSLKDYATKNAKWKDTIVVIDEFSGVRRDVLKKSAIMPEFERLLTECAHLIAVDAFLSDVDARVISMYRPGGRLILDQIFQKSRTPIFWLETRNKDGEISLSHDGVIYPLLKKLVEQGKNISVATDDKLKAKSVRDYLESLGYHGTLCSSETVESNRSLLKDPDSVVSELEFFVYTPTAQSGLDCQVTFDCGLALYSGVISPADFLQMIGRCRQCKQWYVSAPRRAIDPTCPVPGLNSKRVKEWTDKLKGTFDDLGINSDKTTGWGLWQSLTSNVERAFHSEYLYCLLKEFFEIVETLEVESDRALWQKEVVRIKAQELVLTLNGDLENGLRLLREQKAPNTDAEIWDIVLAEQYQKYPTVWKELIAQYRSGIDQNEVLKLAKLFSSNRLEQLRRWVQATGSEAGQDLAELYQWVKTHFTSYTSPRWKALQNHALFQELQLDQLASVYKEEKAIANETHFRHDSPVIIRLWQQFQQSPKLPRLFPTVETPYHFWQILKKGMSFFGYQSNNKGFRVGTPGELHPNGKDRKGNQRFVESKTFHFNGWKPMCVSGSRFFQQNFTRIVESINERLKWERELRRRELREQEQALALPVAA